jgi:lactate dehydrogenase-like 2-hydroxyacid dehydrogenase
MTKAKILATRHLPDAVEARLARDYDAELNPTDIVWPASELGARAQGKVGLVISSFNPCRADAIEALPASVRIIATVSVGTDHIDLNAAVKRGIAVTNTPDVLTDATADISMLLMLGAARGASWGDRMVRENRWPKVSLTAPLGTDVSGKRLGILGMGRIGQAVARRAQGFGMKLFYHNRRRVDAGLEYGATYCAGLANMLPHCDFLSINCASTPETRGSINAGAISMLPKGAIIINAARGDIVDDDAVIAGLESGHLAGAGLDVFKGEPQIDPRYRKFDNVFMLPHLGSATLETRTAMGMRAVDNIDMFFRGERPRDLLTGG